MEKIDQNSVLSRRMNMIFKWLVDKLPENLLGRQEKLKTHYTKLYGLKDHSLQIQSVRSKNLKRYLKAMMVIVPLLATSVLYNVSSQDEGLLVSRDHIISIDRPSFEEGKKRLEMEAIIKNDRESRTLPVTLIIKPEQEQLSEEEMINIHEKESLSEDPKKRWEETLRDFRLSVKQMNKNAEGPKVLLPVTLGNSATVSWKKQKDPEPFAGLVLLVGVLLYLYSKRYYSIKTENKNAIDSIANDLPDFINKIMLLLNAGLVVHTAFIKTIDDYFENRKIGLEHESYFYNQLYEIKIRITETNSPLVPELRDFAKRSGVQEFVRFTNIVADNIGLGAALADKLSMESEMLWFSRKKKAVEKGRMAETKLIFPLMLLLLSLVMVTTAPALMDI